MLDTLCAQLIHVQYEKGDKDLAMLQHKFVMEERFEVCAAPPYLSFEENIFDSLAPQQTLTRPGLAPPLGTP